MPLLLASKALAANHRHAHTSVVPLAFLSGTIPIKKFKKGYVLLLAYKLANYDL